LGADGNCKLYRDSSVAKKSFDEIQRYTVIRYVGFANEDMLSLRSDDMLSCAVTICVHFCE
jgi:hypothetical protein